MSKNDTDRDPDELVLQWVRAEYERAIRSNPGREDEVREAFSRAAEPYVPRARATLEEILVSGTDPEWTAKAAELLAKLDSKQGGGIDA